jgi:trehalose 6-phosphate phosphatase
VIEVRSAGMHKGVVVDRLVEELGAGGFVFIGDDLGDVEAFEAVGALAKDGLSTLLVCSADSEESALHPLSDVLVHGPEGVLDLLRQITRDAADLRA